MNTPAQARTARDIWDSWTRLCNGDLTQAPCWPLTSSAPTPATRRSGIPTPSRTRDDLVNSVRQTRTAIPGLRFHTAGRPAGRDGLVAAHWYATFRSDDGTTKARHAP